MTFRIEESVRELRLALRTCRRQPGFALATIVTLALGAGVNTAVFAVTYGVLLRPLPYDTPSNLVILSTATGGEFDIQLGELAEFRKPRSEWFDDDTYVFAYDMDLNVLLNPAYPEREGRNLAGQHDAAGKAVHDEIRAVVTASRAGWVDTVIARPGSATPARKRVYVRSVTIDGRPGIIGSGYYLP